VSSRTVRVITRVLLAGTGVSVVFVSSASDASAYTYPRFQPVSIAFVDAHHGVLAEDDWICQKAHGCQGRLLVTSDGGAHWQVTYVGVRGMHLFSVRGSRAVYAMTGARMLESTDSGLHWRALSWLPAVVSFVTPSHGWKLGPAQTLAHPPALFETQDGGNTWTTRSDPCTGDYGSPTALSFGSATRGWIVCNTEATAGYQGKEVWTTSDGANHWQLQGRTHPIGPPEPKQQIGNLPGFGYPIGATFLADGRGWLLQDRGYMLVTSDGGHTWQHSRLTELDTIAGQSADLLSDKLGFVLLRGCTVRLVRTDFAAATATTLATWKSPTQC
jgi:photosystem II stability/assembly factor-like uncharacterized protein